MHRSTSLQMVAALAAVVFLGLPPNAGAFRLPLRRPFWGVTGSAAAASGMGQQQPQATTAGEDDGRQAQQSQQQRRRLQQGHSRQGALRLAGAGMLGPLSMALAAGPAMAAAGSTAEGVAGASTHKSLKELQFEMMKLGLDLTHAFKFEEAETVYTDLIELYGSPLTLTDREKALLAKAYSNRGNARFNLNRLNEAVVDYSRAIELSPEAFEYWTNRGLAYESMAEEADGDDRCSNSACQFYEASLGNYEHAIILDPENHKLYTNAGDVLTHLGRTGPALEYYRQALMLYPASPGLNGKVALLEIENGNLERGIYLLDSVVQRHPEFNEMVLAAGAIDWNLGRFEQGIDKYGYAVIRDPRLMDDKYLERERHWPPAMMKMVGKLRQAGATDGLRSTAVSFFESRGSLI